MKLLQNRIVYNPANWKVTQERNVKLIQNISFRTVEKERVFLLVDTDSKTRQLTRDLYRRFVGDNENSLLCETYISN